MMHRIDKNVAWDSYEGLEHADAWPAGDVYMQPVIGGRVVHKQCAGRGQHLRAVGWDELAVLELGGRLPSPLEA